MSKIKCLGSSSAGNCFLLYAGNDILILDAGLGFKDINKSLNYGGEFESVRGCLVTHL